MPHVIEGSVECRSCSEKYPVRYRLDEPAAGPTKTTARRCPKCDRYVDVEIAAGGYFLELVVSPEIALEASGRDAEEQFERELKREKQAPMVRLTTPEERKSALLKAEKLLAELEAENIDPADHPGCAKDLYEYRDYVARLRVEAAAPGQRLAEAPVKRPTESFSPKYKIKDPFQGQHRQDLNEHRESPRASRERLAQETEEVEREMADIADLDAVQRSLWKRAMDSIKNAYRTFWDGVQR